MQFSFHIRKLGDTTTNAIKKSGLLSIFHIFEESRIGVFALVLSNQKYLIFDCCSPCPGVYAGTYI